MPKTVSDIVRDMNKEKRGAREDTETLGRYSGGNDNDDDDCLSHVLGWALGTLILIQTIVRHFV